MAAINSLTGEGVGSVESEPIEQYIRRSGNDTGDAVPDGTEWIVAIIVLGALFLLVGLRGLGFQAMIAAKL